MKPIATIWTVLFMVFSLATAHPVDVDFQKNHALTLKHVNVDIDGTDLIFRCRDDSEQTVVIQDDYTLRVNGETVSLTAAQRKLVMDVYNETFSIVQEAMRIARKGIKLGLKGARVGLSAAFDAIVAAIMGEDEESIESRVEAKTSQLEAEAQRLEAAGNALEERAEALEELMDRLFSTIPQLQSLPCYQK